MSLPGSIERLAGGWKRTVVALDPTIWEDLPSCLDVKRMVSEMNDGLASGFCGVLTELLKACGDSMMRWLRTIIPDMQSTSFVPLD